MFLATETKENIEVGLQFFKDSIDYTSPSKLILFVDKDFDYINVIKDLFPGCKVFLCGVHVYRYMKDKVLPKTATVLLLGRARFWLILGVT